jgi:N-acetylglucosaminyldiphosphoundecaprenol N-acetyl-beta-D-mannosaminyltransferase
MSNLLQSRNPSENSHESAMQRLDPQAVTPTARLGPPTDLSRQVFGILGIPVDVLEFPELLVTIKMAAAAAQPFLISTANVNYLITSRLEPQFRESLLISDLCPADGMPIVLIARLLGVPIKNRLAGSDIFDALRSNGAGGTLKVFLFGGGEGVAATVSRSLNAEDGGLQCVGSLNPGFGSIAEMSKESTVETINSSGADLLAVFLSASKAQGWLLQNYARLQIPVRFQLGATINFQAGLIRRSPRYISELGLEWLWRIKEEPYLWRRYWIDGTKLVHVLLTCVLPLRVRSFWKRFKRPEELMVGRQEGRGNVTIKLSGAAIAQHVDRAILFFEAALHAKKPILIDLSETTAIDSRFFGLFLMVRKQLRAQGMPLTFIGVTRTIQKTFDLNGFGFLLNAES